MEFQSKEEVLGYFTEVLVDLLNELYMAVLDIEGKGYKVEGNYIKGSTKIMLVKKLLNSTPVSFIFSHFEKNLLPVEDKIRNKDERFFIETPNLLPVPEDHILFIKDLWQNKSGYGFTIQQKETIAEFILCLLDTIQAYKKMNE